MFWKKEKCDKFTISAKVRECDELEIVCYNPQTKEDMFKKITINNKQFDCYI